MSKPSHIESGPPPLGRRYAVGGRQLSLHSRGSGGPTVVFLPGAGLIGLDFLNVHEAVARLTTSVIYDRGRDWLERRHRPAAHRGGRGGGTAPAAGGRRFRHPTSWSATPSAAPMPAVSPSYSRKTSPAWCCWIRRTRVTLRCPANRC